VSRFVVPPRRAYRSLARLAGALYPVPGESRRTRAAFGVCLLALGLIGCSRVSALPRQALSAEEHNDLGIAYHARGEHARAAREFQQALRLRPDWVRPLANLGTAQLALGDVGAAIDTYRRAYTAHPDDAAVANNLAWALLQDEGRWPEAEPVIRQALQRDPRPRGYYLDTLGVLLLRKGEPGLALDALRAALRDPTVRERAVRAAILRHAGDALAQLGNAEGAARCYGAARAIEAPGGTPIGPAAATAAVDDLGRSEGVC
jgi:tetratricopeptide (TPR) repeat protein